MPDGDVFNRNVKRGWQTAACRMIGARDDPDACPSVLRALGKEIKDNGCPGFDRIVGITVEAIQSHLPKTARRQAIAQLDSLRVQEGNRATEIAVASARSLLANTPEAHTPVLGTPGSHDLRLDVAVRILADLADASMCPAALLAEIVESGEISFQELRSRRQRSKDMVAAAPEARRLAWQLLADPSGVTVKPPRIPRAKQSQAEILVTALTD